MDKIKYIFLDIDGVLNNHTIQSNGYCGIRSHCVDNLNHIINNSRYELQIVICSAWRYIMPSAMTLKGFEYMMLVCGVDCRGIIVGHTRHDRDESDTRGCQVADYLLEHKIASTDYIILDDMEFDYKELGLKHLHTDEKIGLTKEQADQVLQYLNDPTN